MRTELQADFGFSNAGFLRLKKEQQAGVLTNNFLTEGFPLEDWVVKFEIKGHQLIEILENGLSSYPSPQGKWPLVSGFKFKFDPDR